MAAPVPPPLAHLALSANAFTVGHYLIRDRGPDRDGDDFDLSAPYQRPSVWSAEQQQNLIRSLITGLPVGSVTVSKLPYTVARPFRIVDGKQRIEAVRAFAEGNLTVPGWWWEADDLTEYAARARDVDVRDLSHRGRRRFEMAQLPANEYDAQIEFTRTAEGWDRRRRTPAEMLQAEAELYLLLNFGGVAQTDDDEARARGVLR